MIESDSFEPSAHLPSDSNGNLAEGSTEIERGEPLCRTLAQNFRGVKVRHHFHLLSSFQNNGICFSRKDARQVSIPGLVSSAPGAVQARWLMAGSNLEPKMR